ncbi:MAG TPA: hypothetical protein VGU69_03300 [Rhizomicrobium sp.]|nr:hypothetical protein [Rhizomicrobium sp.]
MLQSITIEKPVLGLGQEWLIEYVSTIDGSVFADHTAISQYAAFERALALIGQGFDVIRITEPGGRVIRADAIAEFYLTLSRRGMPELTAGEAALAETPAVAKPRTPVIRRPRSRNLMLVVWIALSLAATATAVATLFPSAIGIVGPHGTVSAEPNYR